MNLPSSLVRNLCLISALGFLALAGRASGDTFSDPLTAPTGLGQGWGADAAALWEPGTGGIAHKQDPTNIDFVLGYPGIKLPAAFTVSLDVRSDDQEKSGAHWAGIAYNIQDAKNYYVFRMSVAASVAHYQVLKCVNGAFKAIAPTDTDFGDIEAHDGFYTLQVQAMGDGSYHYSIKFGGASVADLPGLTDPNGSPFTGGTAGFYASSQPMTLANFHLDTTPGAAAPAK